MNAINRLLERVRERGVGSSEEINPFWRQLIEPAGALLQSDGDVSSGRMNALLGYGAERLPADVGSNRDMAQWPTLMQAVQTRNVEGMGKAVNHVAILHFLKKKRALDDYVAWLDKYRLVSNLGLGRLYWYGERLAETLKTQGRSGPQTFLEIGSGSGVFAVLMADRGLVRHYVMVDLPEMLLNAMAHARDLLPNVSIRYDEAPDFSREETTFWFLETGEVRKTPDSSVAVALNFNSFMEMDEEVRDFYINEIYRAAAPGCLFYNVNRSQPAMTRRDGAAFDNNPLLYPYEPSDRVIEWATDECQQDCRAILFRAPHVSFCISRIAEIRPAG